MRTVHLEDVRLTYSFPIFLIPICENRAFIMAALVTGNSSFSYFCWKECRQEDLGSSNSHTCDRLFFFITFIYLFIFWKTINFLVIPKFWIEVWNYSCLFFCMSWSHIRSLWSTYWLRTHPDMTCDTLLWSRALNAIIFIAHDSCILMFTWPQVKSVNLKILRLIFSQKPYKCACVCVCVC